MRRFESFFTGHTHTHTHKHTLMTLQAKRASKLFNWWTNARESNRKGRKKNKGVFRCFTVSFKKKEGRQLRVLKKNIFNTQNNWKPWVQNCNPSHTRMGHFFLWKMIETVFLKPRKCENVEKIRNIKPQAKSSGKSIQWRKIFWIRSE